MPRRSVRFSPTTVCFHVFQTATRPSHSTSLPVLSVSAHYFIPSIPPATDIIHVHTGNSRLPQFSRTSSLNIYLYEASVNCFCTHFFRTPSFLIRMYVSAAVTSARKTSSNDTISSSSRSVSRSWARSTARAFCSGVLLTLTSGATTAVIRP